MLSRRLARRQEAQVLEPVTDAAGLLRMQAALETVTVEPSVGRYCVSLAVATREHPQVLMGASPRGALALMLTARAYAVIGGRDYVVPEDVKAVAPSVLAHRVTVRPELWMSDVSGTSVVRSVLAQVETPHARQSHERPAGGPGAAGPVVSPVARWRPTAAWCAPRWDQRCWCSRPCSPADPTCWCSPCRCWCTLPPRCARGPPTGWWSTRTSACPRCARGRAPRSAPGSRARATWRWPCSR